MKNIKRLHLMKEALDNNIEALQKLKNNLNEDYDQSIEIIKETKGNIIISGIGKSGHIGKKIAATMSSVGACAFFVHPSEANHGDLGNINTGDTLIAISNSGETEELRGILLRAKKLGVKIIAISSKKHSTLSNFADSLLQIPDLKESDPEKIVPTTSSLITLAIGDLLAISQMEENNFTKSDFNDLHPGGTLGLYLLKAKDVMTKGDKIPLINEDDTVRNAIIEITSKKKGSVIVVDNESNIKGIITDGDIRRNILKENILDTKVKDIMTKNTITKEKDILVSNIISTMEENKISVIIIEEKGKPKGIININDIKKVDN